MPSECPPSRRKFHHEWDAVEYFYHKILYWFYQRQDRGSALRFCDQLEKRLQSTSSSHEAILGEAAWSLLWEVKGNLPKAIKYRESEIKLIKRLWEISLGTPGEDIAFERYDASDLSDRLDLLATLYHDAGNLDKAISILRESERFCKAHRIRFDGQDLLRDYLAEKKRLRVHGNSHAKRRNSSLETLLSRPVRAR
jgi:tetratricopeptide (TPR) repeat protein